MAGNFKVKLIILVVTLVVLVSGTCFAGAADITARIGDRVDLKGSALNTDTIYLFVTGPGLPADGVRPDMMTVPVISGDPSTFTATDVVNDRWAYTWNTARQGFSLKDGLYTVYATKKPVGKSDLVSPYGSVTVSLTQTGEPYRSPGTLAITTYPVNAVVFIDGTAAGTAPLTTAVSAGVHQVRLESPGYSPVEERITVEPGAYVPFQKALAPLQTLSNTPSISPTLPFINESPEPAPAGSGTAPTRAALPVIPVLLGLAIAALVSGLSQRR